MLIILLIDHHESHFYVFVLSFRFMACRCSLLPVCRKSEINSIKWAIQQNYNIFCDLMKILGYHSSAFIKFVKCTFLTVNLSITISYK